MTQDCKKKNVWNTLINIQGYISVFLMMLIPCMVFFQVLLRYVFKAPLMGIEELMLFPTIWLYMLGGANASYEREHISCGILTLYIKKEKSMEIFNIAKALVSVLVSLWLTYWSYWYFAYSLKMWKYSDLVGVPMFFGESALLIGIALMTFFTILELYDYMKVFMNGTKNKEEVKEC